MICFANVALAISNRSTYLSASAIHIYKDALIMPLARIYYVHATSNSACMQYMVFITNTTGEDREMYNATVKCHPIQDIKCPFRGNHSLRTLRGPHFINQIPPFFLFDDLLPDNFSSSSVRSAFVAF